MAHLLTAGTPGTPDRPTRAAWRETPTAEALAFDRWRFSGALGGVPGEARVVRPGAFGLFFDCPAPLAFLDPATGQPRGDAMEEGGIAVLRVTGPLEHQDSWWWASYHAIRREVDTALGWPSVRAVVLKIDSPGGVCAGMLACHRALRELRARHRKPLVAFVDELAASAAYGLASACDEIWLPPEGSVGSIGVILCTIDESAALEKAGVKVRYVVTGARKADMQPGAPLTDEVLSVAQSKVDELGDRFFETVAPARGLNASDIKALEAAMFMGDAAVEVKLADGVSDWGAFLGTLRGTLGATVSEDRGTDANAGERKHMATLMQLQRAKEEADAAVRVAQAAVGAAKGPAMGPAAKALTDALAKFDEASAKVTHYKKLEEKTVESPDKPDDDAPPSTVPSKEDEEAMGSKSDMGAEGDEDEPDAKGTKALMKAYAAGTAALKGTAGAALTHYGPRSLLAMAEKALGVQGPQAVIGALSALPERLAAADKLVARVAKLEAKDKTTEVNALVERAKLEGRTQGKEHRAQLRAFGAKHGAAELRGMIAMLPKAVRTQAEGHLAATEGEDGSGQFARAEDEQQKKLLAQITADMTPEQRAEFEKDFTARLAGNAKKTPKI